MKDRGRNDDDVDISAELRAHIDAHVEHNVRAGMAPDEARRPALLTLGGVARRSGDCAEGRMNAHAVDGLANVVPAAAADLDRYIDLLEELADWMHSRGIEQWPRGRARSGRDYYKTSLERGELYVAFEEDMLVGGFRLLARDPIVWPEDTAGEALYIYNLAVRRTFQGRGFGRALIACAERHVIAAGRRFVRLDCIWNNTFLRRYYEDAGFVSRGEVDAVYPGITDVFRLRRYEKAVRT